MGGWGRGSVFDPRPLARAGKKNEWHGAGPYVDDNLAGMQDLVRPDRARRRNFHCSTSRKRPTAARRLPYRLHSREIFPATQLAVYSRAKSARKESTADLLPPTFPIFHLHILPQSPLRPPPLLSPSFHHFLFTLSRFLFPSHLPLLPSSLSPPLSNLRTLLFIPFHSPPLFSFPPPFVPSPPSPRPTFSPSPPRLIPQPNSSPSPPFHFPTPPAPLPSPLLPLLFLLLLLYSLNPYS